LVKLICFLYKSNAKVSFMILIEMIKHKVGRYYLNSIIYDTEKYLKLYNMFITKPYPYFA